MTENDKIKRNSRGIGLKFKLIMLSFAPLFLLTIIKNWPLDCSSTDFTSFVCNHFCLLLVMGFCLIGIIIAGYALIDFKFFRSADWEEGYTVKDIKPQKAAGIEFLLTYVLPISINDLDRWQNAAVYFIIVALMIGLLNKTNLFYANPILAVLGYQVIEFSFSQSPRAELEGELIGICSREIDKKRVVKFKMIGDNVLCLKQKKERKNEHGRDERKDQ